MAAQIYTVLTIEDDALIRESFRFYLEDHGYKVLEAENGRKGMEVILEHHPDVVLLDLRMPEMDGLEVLQQVRIEKPDLPVIVISGTGVIGNVAEAMRQGACNYLLKPIADFSILRYALEHAFEKTALIEENRVLRQQLSELKALLVLSDEQS